MRRTRSWTVVFCALLCGAGAARTHADVVTVADLQAAAQWVQRHLLATDIRKSPRAELEVWHCHGGILRNGRAGRPLVIADHEYRHGLLTHAPSKVVVRLDKPARSFSAVVGLDSNEQTRPGLGSVDFSVTVNGTVAARSPVLREGIPGEPLSVDLGGATSFALEVGDAGDGIASDHAVWADAQVVLADGRELWLGDLPEASGGRELPFSFVYDGTPAKWLLPSWDRTDETQSLDAQRVRHFPTSTWQCPAAA